MKTVGAILPTERENKESLLLLQALSCKYSLLRVWMLGAELG